MKYIIVTGQVTYMPKNYIDLFSEILKSECKPSAFVLLDNFNLGILKSILGLFLYGSRLITYQLLKNVCALPLKKRENLFKGHNIPVHTFPSMNHPDVIGWVKKEEIDLIINIRTRCIYKKEILKTPKLGCLNIHHGLLPKYRGTLCDLYALSEGRPAGFSIHEMVEKVDAGRIFNVVEVDPGEERNYLSYLKKTISFEADSLIKLIEEISKSESLPKGAPNQVEKPLYTKNPTRKKIKEIIKKGMAV